MTLRMKHGEVNGLKKNLGINEPPAKNTAVVSFFHGVYWRVWMDVTGKVPTFEDIHAPRNVANIQKLIREHQPQLRRLTNKKGQTK